MDIESPPTEAMMAEAYTYQSVPSMGAEVDLADGGHIKEHPETIAKFVMHA